MADGINRPDTDEEFDRQPRQPRKPGNGPLIAMFIVGLLIIGGLIFALVYFLGGSGNLDREMMAYLPADTDMMIGVEVEELLKNGTLKSLFTKEKDKADKDLLMKLQEAGVGEDDISRMLVGGKLQEMLQPRVVALNDKKAAKENVPSVATVVRFKKAVDKGRIVKALEAKEQTKSGKTFYKKGETFEQYFYFPTDSMMVTTESEKLLDSFLTKDSSQVAVSDDMQELARKMSKGQVWLAVGRSAFGDKLKGISDIKGDEIPANVLPAIEGMKGAGVYLKLDGDKFSVAAQVLCADSGAAKKASEGLQKWIKDNLGKPLKEHKLAGETVSKMKESDQNLIDELRKSVKADHSGDMLEVSLGFSVSKTEDLVKNMFGYLTNVDRVQADHHVDGPDRGPIIINKEKFEPKKSTTDDLPEPKPIRTPDPKESESQPKAPPK